VCPFQDHPSDEDALAQARFGGISGIDVTAECGFHLESSVGHVAESDFRAQGASGGLATWFLTRLLAEKIVDRVICVAPTNEPDCLFRFVVCSTPDEVRRGARSAYYPVELSEVLRIVSREEARYAMIGLPCFLKGVARAMERQPRLAKRIVFMAGLVCGQLKSSGFAEYLLRHLGVPPHDCRHLSFRNKIAGKRSSELIFQVDTPEGQRSLPWSDVYGHTWMSGQFKLTPCNYCDDVFAEVADIAFMDAWLPEYIPDGRGTSIVLARSGLAVQVLHDGIEKGEVELQPVSMERTIASQAGVVDQKRQKLAWRLWLAERRAGPIPQKRVAPMRPPLGQQLVLDAYEHLRSLSHVALLEQKRLDPVGLQHYHRRTRLARRRLAFYLSFGRSRQLLQAIRRRIWRMVMSVRRR
jgi:coenzyme F420-reducing hydrogenase beta subunit